MTNDRLLRILEKRANFAAMVNSAKAAVTANPGAAAGAALGGLYGAYQGATGPEAGAGSTILGAATGALGGGLIGGAAQGVARGLGAGGQKNVFSQIRETRGVAAEASRNQLGTAALGRDKLLADSRNIRAARLSDPNYHAGVTKMQHADELAQAGFLSPAAARAEIDAIAAANPYHAYEAAKKKLIYGTAGAGMATATGLGLVRGSGAGAAASPVPEQKTASYRLDQLCAQLRGL